MPGKIFISYRRDDDPNGAARVRDGLAAKFGSASVFMDVDNLLAGQRFDQELAKALAECNVLLAIIGPRWLDLLRARTASGARDYVREEIAGALARKVIVIPVRVGRESQFPALPRHEDLPEEIRDFVLHQKHDLAYERFGRDIAELAETVAAIRRPKRSTRFWPGLITGVIAVAVGYVGYQYFGIIEGLWRDGRPKEGRQPLVGQTKAIQRDPSAFVRLGSGESFRDRLEGDKPCPMCPEMVVVPSGHFLLGSPDSEAGREREEGPQSEVTISQHFAVGKFSVTFDEWDASVADGGCNGYEPDDQRWGRARFPVTSVNWHDAKAYVSWLSKRTGKSYRLLSEAEREYVTRAGTTTPFWWGSSIAPSQANYRVHPESRPGENRKRTVPVDSFEPNAWGLYNVHGNVWEWTEDCWNADHRRSNPDGSARATGDCMRRVLRGGSWGSPAAHLRAAFRLNYLADVRPAGVGFRVARSL